MRFLPDTTCFKLAMAPSFLLQGERFRGLDAAPDERVMGAYIIRGNYPSMYDSETSDLTDNEND